MSGVRDLRLLEAIFAAELNLKSLLGQTLGACGRFNEKNSTVTTNYETILAEMEGLEHRYGNPYSGCLAVGDLRP